MITEKWRPITFSSHNPFLAIPEDAGNMKAKDPVLYIWACDPMSCLSDEQPLPHSYQGLGILRHVGVGNLCPENG